MSVAKHNCIDGAMWGLLYATKTPEVFEIEIQGFLGCANPKDSIDEGGSMPLRNRRSEICDVLDMCLVALRFDVLRFKAR